MVRFLVIDDKASGVQRELDYWSGEHPDVTLEDISCDCNIDENGNCFFLLAYQED